MIAADRVKARFIGLTMVDVSPRRLNTLRDDLEQLLNDYDALCLSGRLLTEILIARMEAEERDDRHGGA